MAVKYRRDDLRRQASGSHGMFDRAPRRTFTQKQRLLFIYLGILTFCGMMLAYHLLGQNLFAAPENREHVGRVTAKRTFGDPPTHYFVTVAIPVQAHTGTESVYELVGEAPVPKESYDAVEIGTPLLVAYTVDRNNEVFITRMSQVAEPSESQVEFVPTPVDSEPR